MLSSVCLNRPKAISHGGGRNAICLTTYLVCKYCLISIEKHYISGMTAMLLVWCSVILHWVQILFKPPMLPTVTFAASLVVRGCGWYHCATLENWVQAFECASIKHAGPQFHYLICGHWRPELNSWEPNRRRFRNLFPLLFPLSNHIRNMTAGAC